MVVEGALEGELDDHLGYSRHAPEGRNSGNSRNGHRDKTVLTEARPVEIAVPRDRDSSFEPQLVAKRQRRLSGLDEAHPVGPPPRPGCKVYVGLEAGADMVPGAIESFSASSVRYTGWYDCDDD
jgi:hypothetical protein